MFPFNKKQPKRSELAAYPSDGFEPIVIVDVGCRWGFAERFLGKERQKLFNVFGFDPDQAECARLQESYNHLPSGFVNCIPIGLAGSSGSRNLYVTMEPACSSLHPPIHFLSENYPALECIKLQDIVTTNVTTLDLWAHERSIGSIDYLKIDTQGSELEILRGGEQILETTRCIDIEVEFNPIYEGQTLFGETDTYLRSKGFVLWRLSNLVHYSISGKPTPLPENNSVCFDTHSRQETEAFGGQLFWADAKYIHRNTLIQRPLRSSAFQRDLILFETLGMIDVVDHMKKIAIKE